MSTKIIFEVAPQERPPTPGYWGCIVTVIVALLLAVCIPALIVILANL